MSHFSVLVVVPDGKSLEEILLPYHEYECTGIEQYIEFVPTDMDELHADYEKYGEGQDFESWADDWMGSYKQDGIRGHLTNPNAKWDWWTIGGRWSNLLKKDYCHGDSGKVEEIDWEGMETERMEERAAAWDRWEEALRRGGKSPQWYFEDFSPRWEKAIEEEEDLDPLRAEWREIRKAVLDKDLSWSLDLRPRGTTREEHARADNALTFAFVDKEGKWNERGHMGWWAIVTDENPDYDEVFWKFVDSLDPSDRVFIVDCHI